LKKLSFIVIKVSISIILLLILIQKIDFSHSKELILGINFFGYIFSLFIGLFALIIAAYRWFRLNQIININIRFSETLKIYFASLFVGQIMLGALAMDSVRTLSLKKKGFSYKKILLGIFYDRLIPIFSIVFIIILMMLVNNNAILEIFKALAVSDKIEIIYQNLNYFIIPLLIIILATIMAIQKTKLKTQKIIKYFFKGFIKPHEWILLTLNAVIFNILGSVQIYIIALQFNLDISFYFFVIIYPLIAIIQIIPISFAGWGVRELLLISVLSSYGVSPEKAFALSFLFGILGIASSIPGFVFLFKLSIFSTNSSSEVKG
jgi:glycosyltransferase 2 family protein